MKGFIKITGNGSMLTILLSVDNIAAVWEATPGKATIRLKSRNAEGIDESVVANEGTAMIELKIKQALEE